MEEAQLEEMFEAILVFASGIVTLPSFLLLSCTLFSTKANAFQFVDALRVKKNLAKIATSNLLLLLEYDKDGLDFESN